MLKIAICDDERYFQTIIKEILINYQEQKNIPLSIDIFESGKELLKLEMGLVRYNIVFLDIKMDEIDGILTAQTIRDVNKDIFIVFITAFVDYSLEGYKVDAIRYILKNNESFYYTVFESMDAILEKMNYKYSKKIFNFMEGRKAIHTNRILYIESKLHKLHFNILEEKINSYTLYGTLDKLEEQLLEDQFVRIHQSYLVNMKHIRSIKNIT